MVTHASILALQIPDFPVAVARALAPALRDRPLIVVTSERSGGRVLALSEEARQAGVRPGMRVPAARRICPEAAFRVRDPEQEIRAEYSLLQTVIELTPCVRRCGPGRIAADLHGTERLLGPGMDAASRLQRQVADAYRLPVALGLSRRTIWSQLAACAVAPRGLLEVLPGREAAFLSIIPPAWVPGVGPKTLELLQDMNISSLGMLRQFSPEEILQAFGPPGRHLLRAVHQGEADPAIGPATDLRALLPLSDEGVEAVIPLCRDATAPEAFAGALEEAVAQCGQALRQRQKETARLDLTIHYGDGKNARAVRRIDPPTAIDSTLHTALGKLFEATHTRRIRIAQLTVRCDALGEAREQTSLFPSLERIRELGRLRAMDAIRLRFGSDAIVRGSAYAARAS